MMKSIRRETLFVAVIGLVLCSAALADKPFAEKHVVLQLSDDDPAKQTLVLNVANNLMNYYGPDKVDVELVAFGPGLKLLLADNKNSQRVDSLASNGMRFAACSNSYRNLSKKLGKKPPLNPASYQVPAGVVRIMDLTGEGYTLLRP